MSFNLSCLLALMTEPFLSLSLSHSPANRSHPAKIINSGTCSTNSHVTSAIWSSSSSARGSCKIGRSCASGCRAIRWWTRPGRARFGSAIWVRCCCGDTVNISPNVVQNHRACLPHSHNTQFRLNYQVMSVLNHLIFFCLHSPYFFCSS